MYRYEYKKVDLDSLDDFISYLDGDTIMLTVPRECLFDEPSNVDPDDIYDLNCEIWIDGQKPEEIGMDSYHAVLLYEDDQKILTDNDLVPHGLTNKEIFQKLLEAYKKDC